MTDFLSRLDWVCLGNDSSPLSHSSLSLLSLSLLALTIGCAEVGVEAEDSLVSKRSATGDFSGNRCGTREVSPAERASVERELESLPAMRVDANRKIEVPVFVHVITGQGRRGNLSKNMIKKQMKVLNRSFNGQTGGPNTSITFKLKKITRQQNDLWFTQCASPDVEEAMKSQLRRGDKTALNIYTCDPNGLLGYATFPWDFKKNPKLDGIVLNYGSLPGGEIDRFDEGDTAVHEVGHWLGLFHTFQGGCNGKGDRVKDTPPQAGPTSGCPVQPVDSCPGAGPDPIENFMDYSDDACMFEFSNKQSNRMNKMLSRFR